MSVGGANSAGSAPVQVAVHRRADLFDGGSAFFESNSALLAIRGEALQDRGTRKWEG